MSWEAHRGLPPLPPASACCIAFGLQICGDTRGLCGITRKNLRWTVCDKRSWAAVLAEADRCHEHRDWREDIDDHCAHVSRRRRWRHMVINVRATRGAVPRDDYICSQIQNQCRAERHCRTGSGASARIRSGIASSFITWNACEELKVRVGHSSVQVAAPRARCARGDAHAQY